MTMTQDVSPSELRTFPLFVSAEAHALRVLARASRQRVLDRGRTLVRSGARLDFVVLLVRGKLSLTSRNKTGVTVQTGLLDAPALFGDAEWAAGVPWTVDVRAVDLSVCILVPTREYERFLERTPGVAIAVYKDASIRHLRANQSVQALGLLPVRLRLLRALLDYALRFGVAEGRRIRIAHRLSMQDLAAAAGVNAKTVQRALRELTAEGLIERGARWSYIVPDLERMRAELRGVLGHSSSVTDEQVLRF
jgi:CRP-like cAMP-binding protein